MDYAWESNYERNIENGLDPAHNEFVHPTHGYSGEKDDYKVGDPTIETTPWGFGFMLNFQAPPIKNPVMRWARNYDGDLEAGSGHVGPSNMWTKIHLTPDPLDPPVHLRDAHRRVPHEDLPDLPAERAAAHLG